MSYNKINISFIPMDNLACGHYRIKNVADLLYGDYKVTINPPGTYRVTLDDCIVTPDSTPVGVTVISPVLEEEPGFASQLAIKAEASGTLLQRNHEVYAESTDAVQPVALVTVIVVPPPPPCVPAALIVVGFGVAVAVSFLLIYSLS